MPERLSKERLKWMREASPQTRRSMANVIVDDLLTEVGRLQRHVRRLSLNGDVVEMSKETNALLRMIGAEVLAASTKDGAAELPAYVPAPYRGRINGAVRRIVSISD